MRIMMCTWDLPDEYCEGCGACPDYGFWVEWIGYAYPWFFGIIDSDTPDIEYCILDEIIEVDYL